MTRIWGEDLAERLTDWNRCPRCDCSPIRDGVCPRCKADLTGPVGKQLAVASTSIATAIRARQDIIDHLPPIDIAASQASVRVQTVHLSDQPPAASSAIDHAVPDAAPSPQRVPTPAAIPQVASVSTDVPVATVPPGAPDAAGAPGRVPAPASTATESRSQWSVQSLLAVAGAGLLAVAAIVFTFFNPDLTDVSLRTAIIAVISILFIGGTLLLARLGLRSSSEAVGALAAVFVAIDVWGFAQGAPPAGVSPLVIGGIGTLVASLALLALAVLARVRLWSWIAIVGLAATPLFFAYSTSATWAPMAGFLIVLAVTLALHELVIRIAPRFGRALLFEIVTLTVLRISASVVVLALLFVIRAPSYRDHIIGTAIVLVCASVLAVLATRTQLASLWSFVAGGAAVAAVGYLPFAIQLDDSAWFLAIAPAATSIAAIAITAVRPPRFMKRSAMIGGAWTIVLTASASAVFIAIAQVLTVTIRFIESPLGLSSIVALGIMVAASVALVAVRSRTTIEPAEQEPTVAQAPTPVQAPAPTIVTIARTASTLGLWLGMLGLFAVSSWSGFATIAQSIVALALSIALSVALVLVPRIRESIPSVRTPLVLSAHGLIVLASVIGWSERGLIVGIGAASILAFIAVAQTLPAARRPVHFGIGYGYGLIIFATALSIAGLDSVIVLCLTTTLGSVFALAVTLTPWLSPRSWYVTLAVTAVPFLMGIAAVFAERSGWTALSTGVTFALALSLLITKREGMTIILRTMAAVLLVPALAVIVVCVSAQALLTSGSPVALPVIAVIVALVIPSIDLIGSALTRRGIPATDVRTALVAIEISAFVTAAFVISLALTRSSAGLDITFLVLLITGVGAAATAFTTRRRYAWWLAAGSWTAALWCVWSINGVDIVEPYILPPALAAVIVGAVFVARGRAGRSLFTTGLAVAIVPSVVLLALGEGTGSLLAVQLRAGILIVASLILIVLGELVSRNKDSVVVTRLYTLQGATVIVAVIAAGGGAIQAVRWGLGRDILGVGDPQLLMLPVLALSALAAVLAGSGGRILETASLDAAARGSRWRYAPAVAFLIAGPIAAVRPGSLVLVILMALTVALLAFMLFVVARARHSVTSLPPVWFIFSAAWCTAVAGWSQRELRVEAFSIPLGLALVGAGLIVLRSTAAASSPAVAGTWTSWPNNFCGSWRLLGPGIVVTFLPSVLATGTDPQTWRAILVMAFALAAILVGSLGRFAAPFVLGLSVLPIEIIVVFSVQIGRTISPLLWWITLATAGAVLLVIAVTSERKGTNSGGITARMRDLT